MPANQKSTANPSSTAKPNAGSLLSGEKLQALYVIMLRCRALEARAGQLSKHARGAFPRPGIRGQEATEVGCTVDLHATDTIASAGRDLIFKLIRGLPLGPASTQLAARSTDAEEADLSLTVSEKSRRPGLRSNGPFGAAVRRALADRLAGAHGVVVAFSRGDSASLGPLSSREQALALAGTHSLPILFVERCVRTRGSAGPHARMQDGDLSGHSRRHGFPGIPVDGNDVIAVYRVAYESLERARRGGGPTLIACRTYPGDYQMNRGREGKSPRHGQANDPIRYMEEHLLGKGLFSEAWKKQLADEFARELDALFAAADAIQAAEKPAAATTEALRGARCIDRSMYRSTNRQ